MASPKSILSDFVSSLSFMSLESSRGAAAERPRPSLAEQPGFISGRRVTLKGI